MHSKNLGQRPREDEITEKCVNSAEKCMSKREHSFLDSNWTNQANTKKVQIERQTLNGKRIAILEKENLLEAQV